MKILWNVDEGQTVIFEHEPMPKERFDMLCKLAMVAIIGAVVVATVYLARGKGLLAIGAVALIGCFWSAMRD